MIPGIDSTIAWIPKINIASPPMKLICLAYLIATLVPKVPINSQQKTAMKLKIANPTGFTPAPTPWAAKIKFSMFPNIINPTKGKYASNNLSPIITLND